MTKLTFDEDNGAEVWYLPKLGFQPPTQRRVFPYLTPTDPVHDPQLLILPGEAIGKLGEMFFVTEMEALDYRINLYREYARKLRIRRRELGLEIEQALGIKEQPE